MYAILIKKKGAKKHKLHSSVKCLKPNPGISLDLIQESLLVLPIVMLSTAYLLHFNLLIPTNNQIFNIFNPISVD